MSGSQGGTNSFREQVEDAHAMLRGVFEETPLQFNQYLSDLHDAKIWLKREDLSPVRSYKIRGAYVFITDAMKQDARPQFMVCASAGNHAQGFSHACRHFKTRGVIFMPVTTPQQKIQKTRAFGDPYVEIRLEGDSFDDANHAAFEFCREEGGVMVPPFNDPRIICGQATVAKEILDTMDVVPDLVFLPVGGGGLSAGLIRYFEAVGAKSRFKLVEPDGAPSLKQSLETGNRIKLDEMDNFVDGAAVAQVGKWNYEVLGRLSPDDVISAPTNGVCATMLDMLNIEGIVLEPAGALSVDALKRVDPDLIRGKTIVCVTSGGNFDFERLPEVKERALKFSGLKKYFILQFPQRPGALKDFLFMLGPDDDIARFEYLKKSARNFGSVLIGLETNNSENFETLKRKMTDAGMRYQDITENEIVANLVI